MQYVIFAVVWVVLVTAGFWIAGASATSNLNKLNSETGEINPRRTHQLHFENNTQLFIITVLLAGILAVLIATMLVRM